MSLINDKNFRRVFNLGLIYLEPWFLLKEDQAKAHLEGLQKRYPSRVLLPFARRGDNDDIACFEEGKGETVQIIHDFASPGFEQRQEFPSFWDWFRYAVEEMILFE